MADEHKEELFAVFSEAAGYQKALLLHDLTFARLIDDVVFPLENNESFFIDGVPLSKEKLTRIKILRQKEGFSMAFTDLHWGLRRQNHQKQKLYGEQYHIRFEAILREAGEDVTSQVIKAFDTTIKPKLKDYLPKREELIQAASKVFIEGMKLLNGT
ncbi:MAG: hypothetical protein H8D23_40735 [Candidatus Brocadiales bacterium]|nr:hypothetical protein [Candidatus Brocadiales bacterium]